MSSEALKGKLGVTWIRALGAAGGGLGILLSQVLHAWSSWLWNEDPREHHNRARQRETTDPLPGDDDDDDGELQAATNTTLFWVTHRKKMRFFP